MASRTEAIDYDRLGDYFKVLAAPSRLQLLRLLQVPRTVAEIHLAPSRRDQGRSPDRPVTRHAIELHLERLREVGLVRSRSGLREGRKVNEFVVDVGQVFALGDELRRLSLLAGAPAGAETVAQEGRADAPAPLPPGPSLVMVRGPEEGLAFPLSGPGPWLVGREAGLAVPLPHDPFVSKHNTRLRRGDGGLLAEPVPGARNGTRVNWRVLAEGEAVRLRPADVLGVGRSLLLYREG